MAEQEVDGGGECIKAVTAMFPDICPAYLLKTCSEWASNAESVITHIVDQLEAGIPYPKQPRGTKRKCPTGEASDSDNEAGNLIFDALKRYQNDQRMELKEPAYKKTA
jgi:hypothetical protein